MEEGLVCIPPVLVNAERHGRSPHWVPGEKEEVALLWGRVARKVGRYLKEVKDVQGHGAQRTADFIAREGRPARHTTDCLCRRRVENLAFKNLRTVARIEDRVAVAIDQARPQQCRKVAGAFHIGWQGSDAPCAFVVPILLPLKKEEALIPAIIKLGNPDRTAQTSAKVVLMIGRLGCAGNLVIVKPGICIQLVVSQDFECRSMKSVHSGFCTKTLHAS